jgi:hypothetical protein
VRLFRRKETLNEQLLREAGLEQAQALRDPAPLVPLEPPRSLYSRSGLPDGSGVEPREWDTAVTVSAPALAGDRVEFTTIPNGDVILGEEAGDADLSPLADALERHVSPPYAAQAVRQDGDVWAVVARQIEVAQIPFPDGEKLGLSRNGDVEELRVDGEPSDAAVPSELEQLGEAVGDSFYVEAERIDGDLWEVRAAAL